MALNWNTGLYPEGDRDDWDWTAYQFAAAIMAIHEAAHADLAALIGATNIRISVRTTPTSNHGHTDYEAPTPDKCSPYQLAAILRQAAAGQQAELLWWRTFEREYQPDRDEADEMLASFNPFSISDADQALIDEVMPLCGQYRGNLPRLQADTAKLVADRWAWITRIAKQVIANRGHWAA